jgi:hypothetical protein
MSYETQEEIDDDDSNLKFRRLVPCFYSNLK